MFVVVVIVVIGVRGVMVVIIIVVIIVVIDYDLHAVPSLCRDRPYPSRD